MAGERATDGVRGKLSRLPSDFVNVRSEPNLLGIDLGDLTLGTLVTYYPRTIQDDWIFVEWGTGSGGWVSLQAGKVEFVESSDGVIDEIIDDADEDEGHGGMPAITGEGVDISSAQANPDWARILASGISFAIIRATQGVAVSIPVGVDERFRRHMDGAIAAGMPVGVYHAFIAKRDGVEQAKFFHANIAPYLDKLVFPPAIDVELTHDQSPAVIADRLHDMAVTLEGLTGQKPMIYTSNGFWNSNVGGQWDGYFATLPLWVAHWTTQPQPLLPRGWNRYKLWQFTDKSVIDGFAKPVDRNRLAT